MFEVYRGVGLLYAVLCEFVALFVAACYCLLLVLLNAAATCCYLLLHPAT